MPDENNKDPERYNPPAPITDVSAYAVVPSKEMKEVYELYKNGNSVKCHKIQPVVRTSAVIGSPTLDKIYEPCSTHCSRAKICIQGDFESGEKLVPLYIQTCEPIQQAFVVTGIDFNVKKVEQPETPANMSVIRP